MLLRKKIPKGDLISEYRPMRPIFSYELRVFVRFICMHASEILNDLFADDIKPESLNANTDKRSQSLNCETL